MKYTSIYTMAPPKRRKKTTTGWTRRKGKGEKQKAGEKLLQNVYYGYGNVGALQNNPQKLQEAAAAAAATGKGRGRKVVLTGERVMEFLSKQPSYTVHHRVRKRQFPRRKLLISVPKLRLEGDLLELRDLSSWNSGVNYALVLIDAFTRFVWVEALKNKESKSVADAFLRLHRADPDNLQPLYLYTDAGREFTGAPFQAVMKQLGIQHRVGTAEEFHCPFVERVIRTLKEKLFQAMTAQHTRKWVDILPLVVKTYNQTEHSSIGMSPGEARQPENYLSALQNTHPLKGGTPTTGSGKKYHYKKGDLVRILKGREGPAGMHKGYTPNFSWEIFRIKARANTRQHDKHPSRPPAYILEDLKGEVIENAVFYEPELVRVHPDQLTRPFPIREILAQKGDRVLVWFQGHAKSEAVWLPRANLV